MALKHLPPGVRRKRWWKSHADNQLARRLAWRAWKSLEWTRKQHVGMVTIYRGGQQRRVPATDPRPMPAVFCLDRNPDETLGFLAEMRAEILAKAVSAATIRPARNGTIHGYFDFSSIQQIGVSAALVLAALYDRQKSIARWKLSTVDEHLWSEDVHFVLGAVGFHQLLDMQPQRGRITTIGGLRILRFRTGHDANGPAVGFVQEALADLLPDDERAKLLYAEPYAGILEAVLNSHSWAYPDDADWDYPAEKRWWVTGLVDLDSNTVSFAVYDQGITIPVSLPRWRHAGALRTRLDKIVTRLGLTGGMEDPSNDGLAIALAVKVANTSTELPQHGKGLVTMIEVAQRARAGRLRIVSRYGEYVWQTGTKPTYRTMPEQLYGTLVEWTLDL